ncbi:MAG TPA: cyclic nucleotide-binding domain-containing protein [Acidimicrobiales bacterium]|nr:cyclic nucleotide-binding domain-containing protein [Acidimicrobiales bacterium]
MRRNAQISSLALDLEDVPGFAGCSRKDLALIDTLCDRFSAKAGDVLLREGSYGCEAYVVVKGTVAVTMHARHVATLGPGDHFGELSAIESGQRTANVTALSDVVALVAGPREFARLTASVPGFREALLRGMVRKLRAADETIVDGVVGTVTSVA